MAVPKVRTDEYLFPSNQEQLTKRSLAGHNKIQSCTAKGLDVL